MARTPEGSEVRTETIAFRLTKTGRAELDRLRGNTKYGRYLRDLIAAESRRKARRT